MKEKPSLSDMLPPDTGVARTSAGAKGRSMEDVMRERHRSPRYSPDVILPAARTTKFIQPPRTARFVTMGLSTGGIEALEAILPYLPPDSPPIVIVQHMPERAVDGFVRHMNNHCALAISKACEGDILQRGRVWVAPGDRHLLLRIRRGQYFIELSEGPLVSLHRPSIDVLFRSASYAGANAVGVIMTGLGDDGVLGLKEMRDCGAHTLAQDQTSCVAASMPNAAIRQEAAIETASLTRLTELISRLR